MAKTLVDQLLEEIKLKKRKARYGYVSVVPAPAHSVILDRWANKICQIKFSVPKKEQHVTLMYDTRNKVEINKNKHPLKGRLFTGTVVNVDLLGQKNDVLALILDSPGLAKRHAQLKSMGFKHSYPKYLPHITIKEKNTTRSDFISASANLLYLAENLPEIVLYRETWEEIVD